MRHPSLLVRLSPLYFVVGLVVVWELAIRLFAIPAFVLPPPGAVAEALWQYRAVIFHESLYTLGTTVAGFAMAVVFGLVLGLALGWSQTIYTGLYPLMIGFNAIPKVAVVPILVL
ncbi:MAG: ABC transporter permease, partial [Rhizobiales bacterium]|nr:ABC transporter permease [Hyphomicrobiales bacterium]